MSQRSGELSHEELETIKAYRYRAEGASLLDRYVFEYPLEFLATRCLPDWLAPNTITVLGMVPPMISALFICGLDPSLSRRLPGWVWLFNAFAAGWFQVLDCLDGRQARRTQNCSPLGQILDHFCDTVSLICFHIQLAGAFQIGGDRWRIWVLGPLILYQHYSFLHHGLFTSVLKYLNYSPLNMGITEMLVLIQCINLAIFFLTGEDDSQNIFGQTVTLPGFGRKVTGLDLMLLFGCSEGVPNLLGKCGQALRQAREKRYAALCLLPYVQCCFMLYASGFSQLFEEYSSLFIVLVGVFFCRICLLLNMATVAGVRFRWLFVEEPALFLGLVYADSQELVGQRTAALLYLGLLAFMVLRTWRLMHNISTQICRHLNLSFWRVKQRPA